MPPRPLLALGCLACGLVLWLIVSSERGSRPARAGSSPPDPTAEDAPTESREVPALPVAPATPSVAPEPARSPREPELAGRPLEPVRVRVHLALASGEPANFANWTVEAQSWIQSTNATFLHETRADAAGLAVFSFPDFVHIDWVRCIPPPESGLALAFSAHHEDLEPGDSLEATLALEQGGILEGRVVDLAGAPVADARVHAYAENGWDDLALWEPGFLMASTGADGRYRFSPLPPGTWQVAVEPDAWLQIQPALWDDVEERNAFEIAAGESRTGGDLIVAALARRTVFVLDAADRPAGGARLVLQPLDLGGTLLAHEPEAPSALEVFLGRAQPRGLTPLSWPYDSTSWSADEDGRVALLGVAGTWELDVRPALGQGQRDALRRPLELPGPDVSLHFPCALTEFSGRVVDAESRGITRARARLFGGDVRLSATVSAAGVFTFERVAPGPYRLELTADDHLPATYEVLALGPSTEVQDYLLRPGTALTLRFVDRAGAPLLGLRVWALATLPNEPLRNEERARGTRPELAWTNAQGRAVLGPFPSGQVEIAVAPSSEGVNAPPLRRRVVPVQKPEQRVELDLDARDLALVGPSVPTHLGRVVAAGTRAPLGGAWVAVRGGSPTSCTETSSEGLFWLQGATEGSEIVVCCSGYLTRTLSTSAWSGATGALEIELQEGRRDLALSLLDRDGEPLPSVHVRLLDESGRPLVVAEPRTRPGGDLYVPESGRLLLVSVPPGRLDCEVLVEGHALGHGRVEVRATLGLQEERLSLERPLAELRAELEEQLGTEAESE